MVGLYQLGFFDAPRCRPGSSTLSHEEEKARKARSENRRILQDSDTHNFIPCFSSGFDSQKNLQESLPLAQVGFP